MKKVNKHLWKRFKDLTLSSDSEEYQRMLAGTRIYFSLMYPKRQYNIVLAMSIVFSILFSMQHNIAVLSQFMPLIICFYVVMTLLVIVTLLYESKHIFSIKKGIKILLRNRHNLYALTAMMLLYTLMFIYIPAIIIMMLGIIPAFLAVLLFIEIRVVDSTSLIKYAKEQVNKIISYNESKETTFSRYQLYYFAIYHYYSMEKKEIKNFFRDDVLLSLKFDKFPILASQIIYNDNKKRKILVDILSDLEEIKPIMDAKKFLKIMNRIDAEFGKSLFKGERDVDLKNIFQKQSLYGRVRIYLLPLIPIAMVIINVLGGLE